jgi:hypothetical protein
VRDWKEGDEKTHFKCSSHFSDAGFTFSIATHNYNRYDMVFYGITIVISSVILHAVICNIFAVMAVN